MNLQKLLLQLVPEAITWAKAQAEHVAVSETHRIRPSYAKALRPVSKHCYNDNSGHGLGMFGEGIK